MFTISLHCRNFAVVKIAGYFGVFRSIDKKATSAIRADKNRHVRSASFVERPLLKSVIAHVYATFRQIFKNCADGYGVCRPNRPRFMIPQAFERQEKRIVRIVYATLVNQIPERWYK